MRPKLLEIEGLQSFCDAQRIDFEALGEAGLFGIFGPTGSGKSTVLDAVTFALYGKVKRADGGTQGIININMNIAKVSFTFELIRDGARKTFRVERTYQRKKGTANSCEPKVARLIEITGAGEIPVCDKATEVSSNIKELLGLSHEDFTRAVVLPQNSFQEFLLLNNSDRRKMLERIFYLEEYGKQLQDKLNRKMSGLKSRVDVLSGELKGYADATGEALEEARKAMEAAMSERNRAEKELKLLSAKYNEAKEVWSLVQELSLIRQKEQQHLASAVMTAEKRAQLGKAVKAEGLQDMIRKNRELDEKFRETGRKLEEVLAALPGAASGLEESRREYEGLKSEAAAEQPGLVALKTRLADALVIRTEIQAIQANIRQLQASLDGLGLRISNQNGIITKETGELETLEQKLGRLKQEIEPLKTEPGYRQQIQEGAKLEHELETVLKLRKSELDGMKSKIERQRLELEKLTHNALLLNENREKAGAAYEQCRLEVEAATAETDRNAARMLSKNLTEGEPCPVCGSVHHPRPADHGEETEGPILEKRMQAAKERLADAEKTFKEAERAAIIADEQVKALSEQIAQAVRELEDKSSPDAVGALNEKQQRYSEFLGLYNIKSAAAELARLAENDRKTDALQKQMEQVRESITNRRTLLEKCKEELRVLNADSIKTQADFSNLSQQKDVKESKLKELAGEAIIEEEIKRIDDRLAGYLSLERQYHEKLQALEKQHTDLVTQRSLLAGQKDFYSESLKNEEAALQAALLEKGFKDRDEVEGSVLSLQNQKALEAEISEYDQTGANIRAQMEMLQKKLNSRSITEEEWNRTSNEYEGAVSYKEECVSRSEVTRNNFANIKNKHDKWVELNRSYEELSRKQGLFEQIQKLLRANSFIDFIAEERLRYVAAKASETLGVMTKHKYALELDADAGFIIRDNANGGVHRMVNSLSGGETFLTSLSLALALSDHIQLKGQSPLEFFFLDEGFGTLDNNLLDTVIDSLERLSRKERVIGLISHVPELRSRIARRLIVDPPTSRGDGSRVRIEKA